MHINIAEGWKSSTLVQLGAWVYSPGSLQDRETEITRVKCIIINNDNHLRPTSIFVPLDKGNKQYNNDGLYTHG